MIHVSVIFINKTYVSVTRMHVPAAFMNITCVSMMMIYVPVTFIDMACVSVMMVHVSVASTYCTFIFLCYDDLCVTIYFHLRLVVCAQSTIRVGAEYECLASISLFLSLSGKKEKIFCVCEHMNVCLCVLVRKI
jgi:hypothetical protein